MSTESTTDANAPSNQEIRATLEKELPKTEHSLIWGVLHDQLGVSDSTPIDLKLVWAALNTTVSKDKLSSIWKALNRPIGWNVD